MSWEEFGGGGHSHLSEGAEENHEKTWVRISCVPIEIGTEKLWNTSQEICHYTILLDLRIVLGYGNQEVNNSGL
jgi:hypothetical protein